MSAERAVRSVSGAERHVRHRRYALLLVALGTGVVLVTLIQPWITAVGVAAGFPRVEVELTGSEAAGLARGAALLALAGGVAILATRGFGRVLVAALVTLAGLGVIGVTWNFFASQQALVQSLLTPPLVGEEFRHTAWPYAAIVGGALIATGGMVSVVRGRHWPRMGSKYDVPTRLPRDAARQPRGAADQAGDPWRALDRGEDPTSS